MFVGSIADKVQENVSFYSCYSPKFLLCFDQVSWVYPTEKPANPINISGGTRQEIARDLVVARAFTKKRSEKEVARITAANNSSGFTKYKTTNEKNPKSKLSPSSFCNG